MQVAVRLKRPHPRKEMFLGPHLIKAMHTMEPQVVKLEDPKLLESDEVKHWFEITKPAEVSKKKTKKKVSRKKT